MCCIQSSLNLFNNANHYTLVLTIRVLSNIDNKHIIAWPRITNTVTIAISTSGTKPHKKIYKTNTNQLRWDVLFIYYSPTMTITRWNFTETLLCKSSIYQFSRIATHITLRYPKSGLGFGMVTYFVFDKMIVSFNLLKADKTSSLYKKTTFLWLKITISIVVLQNWLLKNYSTQTKCINRHYQNKIWLSIANKSTYCIGVCGFLDQSTQKTYQS